MFGCIVPLYLVLLCENTTSSRLVEGIHSQYLVTARIFEHIEPILGACSSESQVGWRLQVIASHHHIASSCNTIFVTQSLSIIINTISHHIASSCNTICVIQSLIIIINTISHHIASSCNTICLTQSLSIIIKHKLCYTIFNHNM